MAIKTNQKERNDDAPSSKKGLQPGFDRVTFIVKDDVAFGLKYIKTMEGSYLKDLVNNALEKFIKDWEKKNNKIPERKK